MKSTIIAYSHVLVATCSLCMHSVTRPVISQPKCELTEGSLMFIHWPQVRPSPQKVAFGIWQKMIVYTTTKANIQKGKTYTATSCSQNCTKHKTITNCRQYTNQKWINPLSASTERHATKHSRDVDHIGLRNYIIYNFLQHLTSVSYTHLTLPTIYSV